MKATARKLPKKTRGFSWSREVRDDGPDGQYVRWRLHRWDENGVLHAAYVCAGMKVMAEGRTKLAAMLRKSHHQLRDLVDDIDLRNQGVTNE